MSKNTSDIIKIAICIFLAIYPIVWTVEAGTDFIFNRTKAPLFYQISYFIHPLLVLFIAFRMGWKTLTTFIVVGFIIMIEYRGFNILNEFDSLPFPYKDRDVVLVLNTILIILGFRFNRKRTKDIKEEEKTWNPLGFTFSAEPNNVIVANPARGIYVQGGAGSGKSESFIKPIIKQSMEKGYSGVLYDFKSPELTHYLHHNANLNNNNISSYFVDFKNPTNSHRVNPLSPEYLKKSAYAFEYSEAIINNLLPETIKKREFWDRDAQSILTGIMWFVKRRFPEFCTLPHIVSLVLECDANTLMEKVSSDPESSGMVTSIRQAIERGAERQVAGVISTLQTALSRLNSPDIFWLLSGNDVDLHINDPENPKFLSLGNDSTLASTYAPAISLIITVCSRLMNQPGKHHSIIILDEAPTIYIPNFEMIPATARSNKVSTVFGVQDYSQIEQRYGAEKAQVILANLGNQFFGRTSNSRTADMIKNLFSRHDKLYWTKSNNRGTSGHPMWHTKSSKGSSYSQSIQERDKVKTSQILNAKAGQFFGLVAEGEPREIIEYQFGYDQMDIPSSRIVSDVVTREEIESNYLRIINEARSIINRESDLQSTNTLIDLNL